MRTSPNKILAATLTLFQPAGQIMPTICWCPPQVLKATGVPEKATALVKVSIYSSWSTTHIKNSTIVFNYFTLGLLFHILCFSWLNLNKSLHLPLPMPKFSQKFSETNEWKWSLTFTSFHAQNCMSPLSVSALAVKFRGQNQSQMILSFQSSQQMLWLELK